MQHLVAVAVRRLRRRTQHHDVVEAEPCACQLAVIGGGIAGRGLVLRAHLRGLAGRLGGAAAPVGGTRKRERIGHAVVDVGEMLGRRRRIGEKAQRDPAGHEVDIGAVIGIDRRRGGARHLIGGRGIAEVESLRASARRSRHHSSLSWRRKSSGDAASTSLTAGAMFSLGVTMGRDHSIRANRCATASARGTTRSPDPRARLRGPHRAARRPWRISPRRRCTP